MQQLKFILLVVTLTLCLRVQGTDKLPAEDGSYEFQFSIDGQQFRHEKKDANGIIKGEFGFITADGIFHVTVYATDEEGHFNILSMKNIQVNESTAIELTRKEALLFSQHELTTEETIIGGRHAFGFNPTQPPLTVPVPLRKKGHSFEFPSSQQSTFYQETSTPSFKPIVLQPSAKACSFCSLPSTSTGIPQLTGFLNSKPLKNTFGFNTRVDKPHNKTVLTSTTFTATSTVTGHFPSQSLSNVQNYKQTKPNTASQEYTGQTFRSNIGAGPYYNTLSNVQNYKQTKPNTASQDYTGQTYGSNIGAGPYYNTPSNVQNYKQTKPNIALQDYTGQTFGSNIGAGPHYNTHLGYAQEYPKPSIVPKASSYGNGIYSQEQINSYGYNSQKAHNRLNSPEQNQFIATTGNSLRHIQKQSLDSTYNKPDQDIGTTNQYSEIGIIDNQVPRSGKGNSEPGKPSFTGEPNHFPPQTSFVGSQQVLKTTQGYSQQDLLPHVISGGITSHDISYQGFNIKTKPFLDIKPLEVSTGIPEKQLETGNSELSSASGQDIENRQKPYAHEGYGNLLSTRDQIPSKFRTHSGSSNTIKDFRELSSPTESGGRIRADQVSISTGQTSQINYPKTNEQDIPHDVSGSQNTLDSMSSITKETFPKIIGTLPSGEFDSTNRPTISSQIAANDYLKPSSPQNQQYLSEHQSKNMPIHHPSSSKSTAVNDAQVNGLTENNLGQMNVVNKDFGIGIISQQDNSKQNYPVQGSGGNQVLSQNPSIAQEYSEPDSTTEMNYLKTTSASENDKNKQSSGKQVSEPNLGGVKDQSSFGTFQQTITQNGNNHENNLSPKYNYPVETSNSREDQSIPDRMFSAKQVSNIGPKNKQTLGAIEPSHPKIIENIGENYPHEEHSQNPNNMQNIKPTQKPNSESNLPHLFSTTTQNYVEVSSTDKNMKQTGYDVAKSTAEAPEVRQNLENNLLGLTHTAKNEQNKQNSDHAINNFEEKSTLPTSTTKEHFNSLQLLANKNQDINQEKIALNPVSDQHNIGLTSSGVVSSNTTPFLTKDSVETKSGQKHSGQQDILSQSNSYPQINSQEPTKEENKNSETLNNNRLGSKPASKKENLGSVPSQNNDVVSSNITPTVTKDSVGTIPKQAYNDQQGIPNQRYNKPQINSQEPLKEESQKSDTLNNNRSGSKPATENENSGPLSSQNKGVVSSNTTPTVAKDSVETKSGQIHSGQQDTPSQSDSNPPQINSQEPMTEENKNSETPNNNRLGSKPASKKDNLGSVPSQNNGVVSSNITPTVTKDSVGTISEQAYYDQQGIPNQRYNNPQINSQEPFKEENKNSGLLNNNRIGSKPVSEKENLGPISSQYPKQGTYSGQTLNNGVASSNTTPTGTKDSVGTAKEKIENYKHPSNNGIGFKPVTTIENIGETSFENPNQSTDYKQPYNNGGQRSPGIANNTGNQDHRSDILNTDQGPKKILNTNVPQYLNTENLGEINQPQSQDYIGNGLPRQRILSHAESSVIDQYPQSNILNPDHNHKGSSSSQNGSPTSNSGQFGSKPQDGALSGQQNNNLNPPQTKQNLHSISENQEQEQNLNKYNKGDLVNHQPNQNAFSQRSDVSKKTPRLFTAQMQVVDKNTNIYQRAPGENEGLPNGISKDYMMRVLYTFNYTVGFHGHHEEGYSNGAKKGYYYVTGRNGVRTRVDYVADETGFHPKITEEVLDIMSDEVPKQETEKEEKYGLKNYEFKWLYFPQESKSH